MLGGFRRFVRSKLGFALFVLLIISFGIFGFQDPFSGVMGGGFVQVGERSIRPADINREVDQVINRIREEEGKILSPRDAAAQGITMQIYQQQVQQAVILEYAAKIGVKASPSAVTNLLMNRAPRFKDALGRINLEEIKVVAREQNQTVEQFQDDIRDSLTIGYMVGAVESAPTTPDILIKPLLTYYGEQRTVSLARLTPNSIPEPKAPTDEELRAWYEQNKQRFAQPERRRISVLTYGPSDFYDKVPVTEEQIKTEYQRRIREFSTPETRDVAQFTGPDRNTLQTLVDVVKQGTTPEEAIKRAPGVSRIDLMLKPGDLTDEQYDKYVFGIPQGQVMGPVQVGEVWYVVLVTKVTPGIPTPLEQVRDNVVRNLQENEARRMFNASEESFYDMAGGIPLEEMSTQIGAPTIMLPPVDANAQIAGHGHQSKLLAEDPKTVRELFTLSAGQMTNVVEGDAKRSIYRLDEVVAPYTLAFEDAKDDARTFYLAQKVQEAADKLANDMVAAVKAGRTFEQAAATSRMTAMGSIPFVRGMNTQIDQRIFALIFGLKQGETSTTKDAAGEPWVVKVDKVEQVDEAGALGLRAQIDSQVSAWLLDDLREVFIRGIQKEVPVNANEAAVKTYFDNLTKTEDQ